MNEKYEITGNSRLNLATSWYAPLRPRAKTRTAQRPAPRSATNKCVTSFPSHAVAMATTWWPGGTAAHRETRGSPSWTGAGGSAPARLLPCLSSSCSLSAPLWAAPGAWLAPEATTDGAEDDEFATCSSSSSKNSLTSTCDEGATETPESSSS